MPTRRAGSRVAEDLEAGHLVQSPPQPVAQFDLVLVDRLQAAFLDVVEARDQPGDAEHVRRAAFEEVRELRRLRLAGRVAAGAALAPGPQLARAGRRTERPVPVGPSSDLWPGKASRSMLHGLHVDRHDAGRLGGVDEEERRSRSRAIAADLRDRLHGAEHVAGVRDGDEPRLRRDRLADGVGVDGAAGVGRDARQGDAPGLFHRPQRPADAVVLQVGGDDVVAVVRARP